MFPRARPPYTVLIFIIVATGAGWWYIILGNAVVIATINFGDLTQGFCRCKRNRTVLPSGFSATIAPKAALLLAKFKFGGQMKENAVIQVHMAQVASSIMFNVVTVPVQSQSREN